MRRFRQVETIRTLWRLRSHSFEMGTPKAPEEDRGAAAFLKLQYLSIFQQLVNSQQWMKMQ